MPAMWWNLPSATDMSAKSWTSGVPSHSANKMFALKPRVLTTHNDQPGVFETARVWAARRTTIARGIASLGMSVLTKASMVASALAAISNSAEGATVIGAAACHEGETGAELARRASNGPG